MERRTIGSDDCVGGGGSRVTRWPSRDGQVSQKRSPASKASWQRRKGAAPQRESADVFSAVATVAQPKTPTPAWRGGQGAGAARSHVGTSRTKIKRCNMSQVPDITAKSRRDGSGHSNHLLPARGLSAEAGAVPVVAPLLYKPAWIAGAPYARNAAAVSSLNCHVVWCPTPSWC